MPYTPPLGNAVNLDIGVSYVPPGGAAVNFDLALAGNQVTGATLGNLTTFGTATFTQGMGAAPAGFSSEAFGTAFISHYVRTVYTVAINPPLAEVSHPTIENAAAELRPVGVPPGGYGAHFIESLLKFIEVDAIPPGTFGSTDVSHFLRYIDPNSIPAPGFGTNAIEFLLKNVQASGIAAGSFGSTLVWRTLYVAPIPWESSTVQPPEELLVNTRRSYIQGFDAARYGTATVFNAQEHILPGGWDSAEFFNLVSRLNTRFVATGAFMGANTPPDRYGQALVENRNRQVAPFGYPQQKFGYTFVANNAEPVYPASIVREGYGTPTVDYVNRTRQLEGWQSSVFSPYAAIYNAAKAVYPVGMYDGALGDRAEIINLNRTVYAHTPPEPPAITGVGIDYAIRYVAPYSIAPSAAAFPLVRRNPEYLNPVGFEAYRTGGHEVISRFNMIRPSSLNVPSVVRVGEPFIYNRNRVLRSNGVDQAEYGRAKVENAIRYLYDLGGIREDGVGRLSIEFRTRTMRANAVAPPPITVLHRAYNLVPDPPGPQYVYTQLFGGEAFGLPSVPSNRITHAGDIPPPSLGRPEVRANTITVGVGFDHDSLIGVPQAYLYRGIVTGAGNIRLVTFFGQAQISPAYIKPSAWPLDIEGNLVDPAKFGSASVYTPHDEIAAPSAFSSHVVPPVRVELSRRFVRPDGIRSLRIGFARFLGVPQDVDLFTYGPDTSRYGTSIVAHIVPPYTGPYTASPGGTAAPGFGLTAVELKNRTLVAYGFEASLYGLGMVGTTRWRALNGFDASRYGAHRVEYLNREILPLGEVETLFNDDDDIGHFPKRTYVTNRLAEGQYTASGIPPGGFGGVGIAFNLRQISPTGINASGVPRPKLTQPRAIAPLGWGGEAFGRTARWSPGELIPYSVDPVGFGQARLETGIFPQGFDAGSIMTGGAFVRPIRVWGFPPVGFHGPLVLDDAGRNLRFVAPLPILPGKVSRPEVTQ